MERVTTKTKILSPSYPYPKLLFQCLMTENSIQSQLMIRIFIKEGLVCLNMNVAIGLLLFIYLVSPDLDLVEIIQEKLNEFGLEIINNPHVSLTRTIVLQFHWINRFISDLISKLKSIEKFTITFGELEVFCNDNCTRTFVGFLAQPPELLLQCVEQLDGVLSNYNLPKYYEDPKFHLSVAWCLGDQSNHLRTRLKNIAFEFDVCRMLRVDKLMCKTGNKIFHFDLV
ncbi:U6 snRNA phosphodiesterase 1 isoform X2 [Adelges cooleyi]|uniref:U6 snRNA phosphodiesterase 1 isoform X2 n=1 Tax=Adelges cooleyi TaxID=133065 RepID=UPI00217F333C|nr:U6 snRNA phosphodiesterase 1 isoform X2 [Adelges cooleyi]